MSRRAQVDIVVERAQLKKPGEKRRIRLELYQQLGKLGHVESVERYVAEPPDGPFRDGTLTSERDIDWDRYTLIRLIGYVTPFAQ